jgi:hypothetical protein
MSVPQQVFLIFYASFFLEECYISSICHLFVLPKLMWLLKLSLDQNLIMIYHKFNGDFKSHVNFERKNRKRKIDM